MDKAISAISIRLNISRLQLLIGILVVVVIAAVIVLWSGGYVKGAYDFTMRAEAQVTVVDQETNEGLPATVTLTNIKKSGYTETQIADKNGIAKFTKLIRGDYQLKIEYSGYIDGNSTLKLNKRKGISASVVLQKQPPKQVSVTGTVVNHINEKAVEGATVTIGEETAKTDKEGKFSVEKIVTGEYDVTVKLSGYLDATKKVALTDDANTLEKINLVPAGRVVFVSNRDKGKRGIYTSNYDGSDAKPLVSRVGEQEDYAPQVSPDQKKVIFTSTREGKKDPITNDDIHNSYIVDIDGKNLKKIGENVSYYAGGYWSSNSKYVIWRASTRDENNNYTYSLNIYNVIDGANKQIYSDKADPNALINDNSTLIAYNSNLAGKFVVQLYKVADGSTTQIAEAPNNVYLNKFKSNNELVYNYYQGSQTKYFVVNTDTGVSTETKLDSAKRGGTKSHNGKLLVFAEDRDGKTDIFTSDLEGNNEKQLTHIGSFMSNIDWSLDDKYIFFRVNKESESALYVVGADGGTAKKVTDVTREGYY